MIAEKGDPRRCGYSKIVDLNIGQNRFFDPAPKTKGF